MRFIHRLGILGFVALSTSSAVGQATVFGIELGKPLPKKVPQCPDATQKVKAFCRMPLQGAWFHIPEGRYPQWADFALFELTLSKTGEVERIKVHNADGTDPMDIVGSLSPRFGKPVSIDLGRRDVKWARWAGEGIEVSLVCGERCYTEFFSAAAVKELAERKAARDKVDAQRARTP